MEEFISIQRVNGPIIVVDIFIMKMLNFTFYNSIKALYVKPVLLKILRRDLPVSLGV